MKAEMGKLQEVIRRYRSGGELIINGVKIEKKKRRKVAAPTRREGGSAPAPPSFPKLDLSPGGMPIWNRTGLPIHILFEFATGYALFDANGVNEILDLNFDPLKSKLAAAIVCGVSNIWAKPGSRVLYLGDVCGNTVSHLSDLVGSDGLVYVVGLSDVVNMVEDRSNVVPIFEKGYYYWKYRMVVGMVDVIIADMVHPHEVSDTADIALNGGAFLGLVGILPDLHTGLFSI